jgi:hypothetical protein
MAGRVSVEDDERSGRSSTKETTETFEEIRELIHELADTVGINYGVCHEILAENLNVRRIAAKCVPRFLTNNQKQRRVKVCLELREKANEDPTFTSISRIITADESWICSHDPEAKKQSSQWKIPQSPRRRMEWQVRSSTKSMLTVFLFST